MKKRSIGILGGTFNPIHIGHLILAEEARAQFDLDQILFIPNRNPPHRKMDKKNLADGEARYKMLLLATRSNRYFKVSRIELDRKGTSYTYDTVKKLKEKNPGARYFFICGTDSLALHSWYRFDNLLKLLDGFLIAERKMEGKSVPPIQVEKEKFKKIQMMNIEISSTEIRRRIRNKETIRYLVPKKVEKYIEKNKIYG